MTAADSLMLDAKQAIMHEHLQRLQNFYQEERWGEALQEIPVTLNCATDLLNEAVQILDQALITHNQPPAKHSTYPPTTHRERGLS